MLLESPVMTEVIAMVADVNDQSVLVQLESFERVERQADVFVEISYRSVVCRDDSLLLFLRQVGEDLWNLFAIFRADLSDGHFLRVEHTRVFNREIKWRMRLVKTEPQAEGLIALLLKKLDRFSGEEGPFGVFIKLADWQRVGVQPDARRISEWTPLGFDANVGGNLAREPRFLPFFQPAKMIRPVNAIIEAVFELAVEMHLAYRAGAITEVFQMFGDSQLILGKRRRKQRYAGCVRQFAGNQRLARGRADWRVGVSMIEARAAGRQFVQVGRTRELGAISA